MKRYVDVDELKENISKRINNPMISSWLNILIEGTPTADAISVVHCKDCKHLMFSDMYGECSKAHMGIVRPDDFCSYGKRKDEE